MKTLAILAIVFLFATVSVSAWSDPFFTNIEADECDCSASNYDVGMSSQCTHGAWLSTLTDPFWGPSW